MLLTKGRLGAAIMMGMPSRSARSVGRLLPTSAWTHNERDTSAGVVGAWKRCSAGVRGSTIQSLTASPLATVLPELPEIATAGRNPVPPIPTTN